MATAALAELAAAIDGLVEHGGDVGADAASVIERYGLCNRLDAYRTEVVGAFDEGGSSGKDGARTEPPRVW